MADFKTASKSAILEKAAVHIFGKDYLGWVEWRQAIRNGNRNVVGEGYHFELFQQSVEMTQDSDLPKPSQYEAYLYYVEDIVGMTAQSRTGCGHPVHLGYPPTMTEHCTLCYANRSISRLSRIAELWDDHGGPGCAKGVLPHGITFAAFQDLRNLWRVEKIWWAELLEINQRIAAVECHYGEIHGEPGGLVHSARLAVRILIQECPYLAEGADQTFVSKAQRCATVQGGAASPSIKSSQTPSTASEEVTNSEESTRDVLFAPIAPRGVAVPVRKKVAFSEEVSEPQGRPQGMYWRPSHLYQPGKHACSTRMGWYDTSFCNDKMYDQWVESSLLKHRVLGDPLPEYYLEENSDGDTSEESSSEDSVSDDDDQRNMKDANDSKSELEDDVDMEGLEDLDEIELDGYIIREAEDRSSQGHTASALGRRSRAECEESSGDDSSSSEEESEVEVKRRRI